MGEGKSNGEHKECSRLLFSPKHTHTRTHTHRYTSNPLLVTHQRTQSNTYSHTHSILSPHLHTLTVTPILHTLAFKGRLALIFEKWRSFFGSEEALRCFEKTESIEEKIRQLWALPTVQASRFLVQEDGCDCCFLNPISESTVCNDLFF